MTRCPTILNHFCAIENFSLISKAHSINIMAACPILHSNIYYNFKQTRININIHFIKIMC